MTNSEHKNLSGIISVLKSHFSVPGTNARVLEVTGLHRWPVWRGHEQPCANNSLVCCLPSYCQLLLFSVWITLGPSFIESMGNERYLGQYTVVSFSTTCKHTSSRISSCASSCMSFRVFCLWWLQLFFKCIWALLPWATWLEILVCDGLFPSVSETAGSTYNQYWAVHCLCPQRWTLQPLPIQNPAIFPNKNRS